MTVVVIIVIVVLVYVLGRSDGKDKIRDDVNKVLTGKRRKGRR